MCTKNYKGSKMEKLEIYRELENIISEMNYLVDGVIVEGPHDKKTLRFLGYDGPILMCSKKFTQVRLVDIIVKKFSEVVVLTDFDEAGESLNKTISSKLSNRRIKVNSIYRRKIRTLLKKTRITTIEGIYRLKLELFSHKK